MSYEAFSYAHKRVRQLKTREWKLWYTVAEGQLSFRLLTKDVSTECYLSHTGEAALKEGDGPIQEDDNGDGYPTEHFAYADKEGALDFYVEQGAEDPLVWVRAYGSFADGECNFTFPGPLMAEIAG